jgi:hypothetical protein
MDPGVLQTAGWVLLGWLALAAITAVLLSAFLAGAHRAERGLPATEEGLRDWVRRGQLGAQQPRRGRARPPAA